MKRSVFSRTRALLVSAATVMSLIAITACTSSSDGDLSPSPATEVTEQSNSANDGLESAPAASGDTASTAAKPAVEATAAPTSEASATPTSNNGASTAASGELQNLVNDGTQSAATSAPQDAVANPATAGQDPFAPAATATAAPSTAASASAAPAATADPFAPVGFPADGVTNDAPKANAVAVNSAPVENATAAVEVKPTTEQVATADNEESEGVALSGGVLPENGTKMPYFIKQGDTLAKIAKEIYGDGSKWKMIAGENSISNPSLIYAGDVIMYTLNEKSSAFAQKYESAPRQVIKVQKGDTLSSIAGKVLGNTGSWRTLWKLNPQVANPDMIKVGATLSYINFAQVASIESSTDTETVVAKL